MCFPGLQQGLAGGFGFDEQNTFRLVWKSLSGDHSDLAGIGISLRGMRASPNVTRIYAASWEGGIRLFYQRKRAAWKGRVRAQKHDWEAQTCLRTYFSPSESSVLNKGLPGLPHLFARCGFPVF